MQTKHSAKSVAPAAAPAAAAQSKAADSDEEEEEDDVADIPVTAKTAGTPHKHILPVLITPKKAK